MNSYTFSEVIQRIPRRKISLRKPASECSLVEAFNLTGIIPNTPSKVKDDMKVEKGIDPAKNCILEQNALKKKNYYPGKPNLGLNRKNQNSRISNNIKNQEGIKTIIGKSAFLYPR